MPAARVHAAKPPVQAASPAWEPPAHVPIPPAGSGASIPVPVRAKMERALGHDFSNIRIHEGPEAASMGAIAYARGTNIHFQPGRYEPHSRAGQALLGHELAHVVQQAQGRVAVPQGKGAPINADPALEAEADALGAKAAAGDAWTGPEQAAVSAAPVAPIQPMFARSLLMGAKKGARSLPRAHTPVSPSTLEPRRPRRNLPQSRTPTPASVSAPPTERLPALRPSAVALVPFVPPGGTHHPAAPRLGHSPRPSPSTDTPARGERDEHATPPSRARTPTTTPPQESAPRSAAGQERLALHGTGGVNRVHGNVGAPPTAGGSRQQPESFDAMGENGYDPMFSQALPQGDTCVIDRRHITITARFTRLIIGRGPAGYADYLTLPAVEGTALLGPRNYWFTLGNIAMGQHAAYLAQGEAADRLYTADELAAYLEHARRLGCTEKKPPIIDDEVDEILRTDCGGGAYLVITKKGNAYLVGSLDIATGAGPGRRSPEAQRHLDANPDAPVHTGTDFIAIMLTPKQGGHVFVHGDGPTAEWVIQEAVKHDMTVTVVGRTDQVAEANGRNSTRLSPEVREKLKTNVKRHVGTVRNVAKAPSGDRLLVDWAAEGGKPVPVHADHYVDAIGQDALAGNLKDLVPPDVAARLRPVHLDTKAGRVGIALTTGDGMRILGSALQGIMSVYPELLKKYGHLFNWGHEHLPKEGQVDRGIMNLRGNVAMANQMAHVHAPFRVLLNQLHDFHLALQLQVRFPDLTEADAESWAEKIRERRNENKPISPEEADELERQIQARSDTAASPDAE